MGYGALCYNGRAMAEHQQGEGITKHGLRCRVMGRRLCDIHSGDRVARRARYGLPSRDVEPPGPCADDPDGQD